MASEGFVAGNIRSHSLRELWNDAAELNGAVSALAIKGHVLGPTTYGFAGQANRLERRGLVAASRGVNTIAQEEPLAAALSFFFCFFSLAVDKDIVCVRVESQTRPLVFENVLVRVHRDFRLDMHIDTDEANSAGIAVGATGIVVQAIQVMLANEAMRS